MHISFDCAKNFSINIQYREEIGRKEFESRVWQWKESKGNRIFEQLKQMGASLDWDWASFTMSKVTEQFNKIYQLQFVLASVHLSEA